jgi:hypothetical protein
MLGLAIKFARVTCLVHQRNTLCTTTYLCFELRREWHVRAVLCKLGFQALPIRQLAHRPPLLYSHDSRALCSSAMVHKGTPQEVVG